MYIVEIHEMRSIIFHKQSNDKRIKANEDQDFSFSGVSEKSHFEWRHKESFENFLNSLGEEIQGSVNCFIYKFLILQGCWTRS